MNHTHPKTRIFLLHLLSQILQVCNINSFNVVGSESYQFGCKNAVPIHHSLSFSVITFSINQQPIRDFLLVNKTNLHAILHRFQDIVEHL